MIEIPNGATFERPQHPPPLPMTKRRALCITGAILPAIGVLGTIVGGAFLIGDAANHHRPAAATAADWSCGFGSLGEAHRRRHMPRVSASRTPIAGRIARSASATGLKQLFRRPWAQVSLSSSLTLAMTCGAWIGLVM